MRNFRSLAVVTLAALLAGGLTRSVRADQIPAWPSEQEAELEQLDSQLIDTKQKLFAARQESDTEAVEQLSKSFKECQDKRVKLLRAMGHLKHAN